VALVAIKYTQSNSVGYALDEHNRKLITPAMEANLTAAKADIISGKLKVTEYKAQ
jgi:basic membrane protein A